MKEDKEMSKEKIEAAAKAFIADVGTTRAIIRKSLLDACKKVGVSADKLQNDVYKLVTSMSIIDKGIDIQYFLSGIKDGLQISEDLRTALTLAYIARDPVFVGMSMLIFKGVVLPLVQSLEDANTTIRNLIIATGNKQEDKE